MRAYANADVRAVVARWRVLRSPFLNLRLLEAAYPGQRTVWPGMLDVGGWHLAGYVDDIDAALDHLASCDDVYILAPGKKPTTNAPEVGAGSYAAHCMTRDGFHFELLTYPNGRAYAADFPRRLWNPAEPDLGATRRTSIIPAVPGFRGFEHLSLAVADVDEATEFFEQVLGCERFYDMGPVADPRGSGFGAYVNVDVRVSVSKVRLFRSPYLNFEVIEPTFPGQGRAVDDLDVAMGAFSAVDVHLLGGERDDGTGGHRACYLTDFGLVFELVQAEPAGPRWHPATPER